MNDKNLFLELLKNKNLYKVYIDNDCVDIIKKEDINKEEPDIISFNEYGYNLLNEIFQALDIDSELV